MELTTAICEAKHRKRQMGSQARIHQMESERRRQWYVESAVWIGGSLVIFVRQKVKMNGIVFWQKSCKLEVTFGCLCVVMLNLRCWHT